MKKRLLYTFLYCFPILFYAQEVNFENGLPANWTNTDGTVNMLTTEMHSGTTPTELETHYLQKSCDGSNASEGEMAIVYSYLNAPQGGFLYGEGWGTNFQFYAKNDNNFPLYLRVGIKGINNAVVVTDEPFILPALSDWTYVNIGTQSTMTGFGYGNLHTIDYGDYVPDGQVNSTFIRETLYNVSEFRILHNTTTNFDGETVTGSLKMDNLFVFIPLSVKEFFLEEIQVFPNPVANQLFVNFPYQVKGKMTILSVDGKQLLSQELTSDQMQVDVSKIKTKGIYFLKIETAKGTLTKKIVKTS